MIFINKSKEKLLNDYKHDLHKYLLKTSRWFQKYDPQFKKYHYYRGMSKGFIEILMKLNELNDDIDQFTQYLYSLINEHFDNTSSYEAGIFEAYTYALISLDKLKRKIIMKKPIWIVVGK